MQQVEQFELFERVRASLEAVAWERLLIFNRDGAKSATQRAIERLGMLQTPTVRQVAVIKGDGDTTEYVDQFGKYCPAISFVTGQYFPAGTLSIEILDGRRRAMDSFNAKDENLLCAVLPEGTNERTVAAASAVLNIARKPNPLQEADGLQHLVELGMDREQIADTLGIPLQTIKKRLRLLQLPGEFQEAIAHGKIKSGVAERIANLTAQQVEKLKKILSEEGSLKGRNVDEVQQVQKQHDASQLQDQLGLGFELPASGFDGMEELPIIPGEVDPWQQLRQVALHLFGIDVSFTQLRIFLSDLNKEYKRKADEKKSA